MRCMGDLHKRLAYRMCHWRSMLRQNDSLRLMRAFRKTREPPRQSFLLVCEEPLEASEVVKVPRIGVLLKLHPVPCGCHSASCLACLCPRPSLSHRPPCPSHLCLQTHPSAHTATATTATPIARLAFALRCPLTATSARPAYCASSAHSTRLAGVQGPALTRAPRTDIIIAPLACLYRFRLSLHSRLSL